MNRKSRGATNAFCPDCDGRIVLHPRIRMGQQVNCPHCGTDLEVVEMDPPELDWVYDWSYEEVEEGR